MEDIWNFFTKPDNREVISWFAGGVAVVVAAIWTVNKSRKSRNDSSSTKPLNENINVRGNENVVSQGDNNDINIGNRSGVNGISLILILIFFLAIATLLANKFGDRITRAFNNSASGISIVSLDLSCGLENDEFPQDLSENEHKDLIDFAALAEDEKDQVIYFSVAIQSECTACLCRRTEVNIFQDTEIASNPNPIFGEVFYDPQTSEERKVNFGNNVPSMWVEGLQIMSIIPSKWAVVHYFYIPRYNHLDGDPSYKNAIGGFFLAYDGLFTVRNDSYTGWRAIHLETIEPTKEQLDELACIRDGREKTFWSTVLHGC